MGHPVELNCIS